MGKIIEFKNLKKNTETRKKYSSQEDLENDLAMFSVLYFQEHFGKELKTINEEVKHALIISIYRFMVEAEKYGEVELLEEGLSIEEQASEELQRKIRNNVEEKS